MPFGEEGLMRFDRTSLEAEGFTGWRLMRVIAARSRPLAASMWSLTPDMLQWP